jgi:hypothetical protein
MAFKDITKVLYNGKIKLDYKDKTHRYYVRKRENWDLSPDDPKAWSKVIYPAGTTTLLGDTLEKKGLMTWPLGLAMRELFGFYDFVGDDGTKKTGFSKGVGTLRTLGKLPDDEELIPIVKSAADAYLRRQKQGADIGSVVHDAIEHYVNLNPNVPEQVFQEVALKDLTDDQKKMFEDGKLTHQSSTHTVSIPVINDDGTPKMEIPEIRRSIFDIGEQYMWNIKEAIEDINSPEYDKAMEAFPDDVEMAKKAFDQFVSWWNNARPTLYGAEDLLYSMDHNVCGTYDGDLGIPVEDHPMKELFVGKEIVRVTADWKTSNASKSTGAASPEGVYYNYFIQLAIYEMCRREMGFPPADDLLTVSARKDGGFSLVYASELGLTVQECIDWAVAVITCYRLMDKTKSALLDHAVQKGA